jgi:hypothetical protein
MQFNIIAFTYDVPFPLMLPNSTFLVDLGTSQHCFIRVQNGLGKTEFTTEVALKEKRGWDDPKCLKGEVKAWNKSGNEMAALDVLLDENSKPLIYRHDTGYASVEVALEVPDSEDIEAFRTNGVKQASEILSTFLLGYRWYANDHTVPDFRSEQILVIGASLGICRVLKTGDMVELDVKMSNNRPIFQWDGIEKHIKQSLDHNKLDAFETWLQSGMHIPEHQRLLLSAAERGILKKEHSLSVIFAQTAFEVFVSDFIKRRAAAINKTQLPVGRKHKKIQYKSVVEALKETFFKAILKSYVPMVTNSTIESTQEYKDWDDHAYKTRNQIVHEGRVNISELEAQKAFESVVALMNKLEALP